MTLRIEIRSAEASDCLKQIIFLNSFNSVLLMAAKYGLNCLKGSPKRRTNVVCLRQVTLLNRFVALYFGSTDLENVVA